MSGGVNGAALHWAALDWALLGPALLAGLLVLVSHVPLGQRVLDRGIVFIDLAIAQVAGLGVLAADAMGLPADGWVVQAAALSAALLGASLLAWTERRAQAQQEALIGVMFVLAASGGVLLLAASPHGGEHLQELLVGQILWVTPQQLAWLAAVTAVLGLALWRGWVPARAGWRFHLAFAVAVTASVQVVGVYLVFASLILPALATQGLSGRWRLATAWGIGLAGYALGVALSALLDWPTSAVVVWALAACALVAFLLRRRG